MQSMKVPSKPISSKQMASIHIAYREFARMLNESGMTLQIAIDLKKINAPIQFTEENVKVLFGYPILQHLFPEKFRDKNKPHHPRLTTTETQMAFENLNGAMIHLFSISMPFPEKPQE